jgi:kynurenine formamidase
VFGKKIVDLSQTIYHMQPVASYQSHQRPAFWDRRTHESTLGTYRHASELSWHIRDFLIGEHVSTHVDALCHYTPGDDAWCMERMPLDWFLTPGLCIDLSNKRPDEYITPQDLQQGVSATGLRIEPGSTLLYHQNYYSRNPEPPFPQDWTGLDWHAAQWLADQGVRNIGCETPSIDNSRAMHPDSNPCFPAHRVCRDRRMINTENLGDLSALVGKHFTFIGLPLKLRGGTGCPIRAVAVLNE